MPYSKVKDLPESIQSSLHACGYRKGEIQILVKETENLFSAGADGYRSFAVVLNISTGESQEFIGSWGGSNPFNPNNVVDNNDKNYKLPKDCAVIRGFSGGTSGITHATVIISPENVMPGLLGSGNSDITSEEKTILAYMRSYTPAYRKPYLDAAKDIVNSLVERGYIKRAKNGALSLSLDGKNACEGVRI